VALDISGATSTLEATIPVVLLDGAGIAVSGVTVSPREVAVQAPVSLLGGFKNVAVKVVSQGQVANGYRLTNISVSPPTVTIFSDNLEQITQIPGFVETQPVDINNLTDDLEVAVDLNLPQGVSLVREPNVLVQVSVAAIEDSLTISVPVQVIGLAPELMAISSPDTVDVIVSGPINLLDGLTPEQFRVVLDLSGLPPGVYQRSVDVDLAPSGVQVQTTLPESVEVTIDIAPTPTSTPFGGIPSATPTPRPTLTPTPTLTPRPTRTWSPTRTPSD
jgi:YbbR domain-containing protein